MKKQEKITYLRTNHPNKWADERKKVNDKFSDKQDFFCCCGKLATGLHEMSCRKFNDIIDNETIKNLKHLL